MPGEPKEIFNIKENSKTMLLNKYDQAMEEVSEIMNRIRELEEELDANSRKKILQGDWKKENEIEREYKELTQELNDLKDRRDKKWAEINRYQDELLKIEK